MWYRRGGGGWGVDPSASSWKTSSLTAIDGAILVEVTSVFMASISNVDQFMEGVVGGTTLFFFDDDNFSGERKNLTIPDVS